MATTRLPKRSNKHFPGKIFRYVDLEDLVPHLPSVSLLANAYTHCQNEVSMKAAQAVAAAAGFGVVEPPAEATVTTDTAQAGLDPATVDRLWGLVKSRIDSHMIGSYQSRIEAKCKEPS